MSHEFRESIGVSQLGPDKFISKYYPERTGNTADIAFGGFALGLSVNAGVQSVPPQFFCYSAQGLYLGPTLTTEKVSLQVHKVRDTKTFKTVRVEALQTQKGVQRITFCITLDFQLKEAPVLKYNLDPRIKPTPVAELEDYSDYVQGRVKKGLVSEQLAQIYTTQFGMLKRFFEMRHCLESVSGQNLLGLDKNCKTTQDGLTITEKSSALWFRSKTPISQAESYAAVAFMTDAALAFLPLTFRNEFITEYGALSSLDCSLRFHTSDFNCNNWLLHEQVTEAADDGRTFSIGRVFREDGVLVATMSQMSILRAKPARSSKSPPSKI
ncbi:protein of unknown function [Taphrina deformans PYCC 5710]|uniref:Acyl-CoA thioesterase II n=1 Tax=Taphrina deformans (strain PYCC 5710 / ATCC 11124 / CBS 356.35 / IMI 108563 / JCM 9778 / NBRC 8474) TaxID=1097556 RepID=R4XK90_TAPDE|nr:protein of unknown function [Taphrina deformans PYCC 5710]|eukprot:CCG84865.1 protein of unknown function [Taphrina deformans PYCC 5710]